MAEARDRERAISLLKEVLDGIEGCLDALSEADIFGLRGDGAWDKYELQAWQSLEEAEGRVEMLLEMLGGEAE